MIHDCEVGPKIGTTNLCGIISTAIRSIDCIEPIVKSAACVTLKYVSGKMILRLN